MISAVFVTWFFAACLWTVNALRRPVPPGRPFPPLWLPGMLVSELAPLYLVVRAVIAALFIWLGAHEGRLGGVGLVLFVLSEMGLLVLIARTVRSARATGHSPPFWGLFRVWDRVPDGVRVEREVRYWNDLTLDIYARHDIATAPALVYVHPGSWMRGRPGRQARALFHRLVAEGWVILDIRYPLSPDATFPEHLIGVKRSIWWARTEGKAFGVDPSRVAIAGGSSGAHLAALAALTWDRSDLQPGFSEADVSVFACVASYGIYDLLVRNPTRYDWPFIARHVMKAEPSDAPDLYELGSPIDQVRPDAPPFLVLHGELDSIVLPSESRQFVEALARVGAQVEYHEVIGGQHGFDAIASLRTRAVAEMTKAWLEGVLAGLGSQIR